jgi:hypothetical protein
LPWRQDSILNMGLSNWYPEEDGPRHLEFAAQTVPVLLASGYRG